ncbi:MAG: geranylgeranyl reductase family protein [Candidatus Nanopelagicales bacterium]
MSLSDADVIVVGAGPSGSTTSYYLAQQGLKVLLLEKTKFPREKVCGDGLTPRSVKQLLDMGIEPTEANGWIKNKGLRIIAGKHRLELNWPELESFPNYGLVRTRHDFDEILAQRAKAAGADLREETRVLGPIRDEKTGRVIGVNAKTKLGNMSFHAPFVVAADGVSARMALALGLQRREDRPMGVAVRTYYKSPRTNDDFMESWLELWDGDKLLPGYGWIFGVGDGTSNVGLGILDSSPAFQSIDYKELLKKWLEQTPLEWGYRDENMVGEIRGAALPMGFNRQPFYTQGLVLVGDSGGMVNPFNGEGIAYAMESGKVAAEVIAEAAKANNEFAREKILHQYPALMRDRLGGYYTLGRIFVKIIGNPEVMKIATKYGLGYDRLMRFTLKLLANLTDPNSKETSDRIINALSKIAPAA